MVLTLYEYFSDNKSIGFILHGIKNIINHVSWLIGRKMKRDETQMLRKHL